MEVEYLLNNVDHVKPYTNEVQCKSAQWMKRRKLTTYILYVHTLLFGTEYSAIVLSLYYYLENSFPDANISLYYCLAMTAMSLSATLTPITLGYYVDKKRNIRMVMIVVISVSMIGNLLYSLHFSFWFIIFGRLLCGLGEAITTAGTGEMARLYTSDELARVMYRLQTLYTIGFVMGPAINSIFLKVDFTIGAWHLTKYNFIGLFLMMMLACCNIATLLCVSNLNKQPDRDEQTHNTDTINDKNATQPFSYKVILTSVPLMLLIISSAMLNYGAVISELIVPIISNSGYDWSFTRLTVVITICVAIFILVSLTLEKQITNGNKRIYSIFVCCLLFASLSLSVLMSMKYAADESLYLQTFLICAATLINSTAGLTAVSMAKILYLQMVPSQWASYSEGIRGSFYRVFGLMGYMSGGLIVPYLHVIVPIVIFFLSVSAILFLIWRKSFLCNLNGKN